MSNTEELNQYGVSKWLIEALKSYDSLMSKGGVTKGEKMKAKRTLEQTIQSSIDKAVLEARIDELDELKTKSVWTDEDQFGEPVRSEFVPMTALLSARQKLTKEKEN